MDSLAPPSFLCPITQEIIREPVTCADGHSYERASIEPWLDTNNTSPKTGDQLRNKAITPTHAAECDRGVALGELQSRSAIRRDL